MSTVSTILTSVGYKLGGGISISSTSDPSQATCIQWLNETISWVTALCAEENTDLGRKLGTITTVEGTTEYDDLCDDIYAPAQQGWIVHTTYRSPIQLRSEDVLMDYDPSESVEPTEFYLDGENQICFPSEPDDAYTVKIPYWEIPVALTATTDIVPFFGIMDNVFIESIVIRAQDRDEYDLAYSLKWQSFLMDRVRRAIALRKRTSVSVS